MVEKRRNYGDEFKREAFRWSPSMSMVCPKRPAIWGSMPICWVAGNVRWKRNRAQPFPGTVACRPTKKNYSVYARTTSGFGWNVTF